MWGSNISKTTLRQLIEALNDPRFVLGGSNFQIEDLTAYVASVVLAHNEIMASLLGKFCSFSNKRDWVSWFGTQPAIFEVRTEQVRPAVQRQEAGLQITGAPLIAKEHAFSISEEGLRLLTGKEFQQMIFAITDGDKLRLIRDLLYRLLTPTQENAKDHRADGRDIEVRGLANGDSWVYPRGIYGNAVTANHNHYLGLAGAVLTDVDLDNGLRTIREHGIRTAKIVCSPTDSAQFNTANIPGFVPAQYVGILPADNTLRIAPGERMLTQEDMSSTEEVFIGTYKGVKVYTLWYWPAGYVDFGPAVDAEEYKPLVCRTFTGGYTLDSWAPEIGNVTANGMSRPGFGDLRVMTDNNRTFQTLFDIHHFEREVGFGAKNRVSHAILSLQPGAYVIPNVDNLIVSI